MKLFMSLLILMSLLITEAVAQFEYDAFGAPTNFKVTGADKKVTLSWGFPSDVNSADITSYKVEFYQNSDSLDFIILNQANYPTAFTENPHWTKEGVLTNNGDNFRFRIQARVNPPGPTNTKFSRWSPWVSGTPNIPAPTDFTATPDAPTTGDRQVTLSWTAPSPLAAAITGYEYSQNGGSTWTSTGGISTSRIVTVKNGISYTFRVRAVRGSEVPGLPSRTVTVTPLINAPGTPGTLNVERVEDTAILTWSPPSGAEADILRYEYSDDGGSTWKSTDSTDTTYTVTGLEPGETYTFLVRAVYVRDDGNPHYIYISRPSRSSNSAVLTFPKPKRRIIQECPVGWTRSDGFAGRNPRVLIYEVNLEMDLQNRVSIYKPVWVAIYVHPDEALENLDGWKLQVALPYNHHREYLLTAENSVVVDAGFVEGGFAFIENPEENPFPMTGIGFTGSPAPGFDYRLYDDTGRKVDFGISCYKRGDIFQVLKEMEDPRVLRKVLLETLNWDAHYLRSEWTVPAPVNAPGSPSLQRGNLVGKWADLKKQ